MSADYFWHLAHKLLAESRASGKKKKSACNELQKSLSNVLSTTHENDVKICNIHASLHCLYIYDFHNKPVNVTVLMHDTHIQII